ncbi:hypothetical protein [Stutzerimonas frequens]|uniref:hypothetical protein n=1 Tax=Stutzerimonas frequens TaxID=2968969 RepID=UPI0025568EA8|nr:hypothetical protein [Stutzerimonas frequens]MDL0438233.1 hypothetical protein [Stutzerimonas frequens]
MKKTLARSQFKKHFGQANHHLVTALVALHTLETSDVIKAPVELKTVWSPKDKISSTNRSRIFVLQSFLGWAVNSVDMYLSLLNRKPNYLQSSVLSSQLDGAGHSVLQKIRIYSQHYKISPATQALMDVLVTWRNNVFHELADNKINQESRLALIDNAEFIRDNYRGLDISDLAEKAEKGGSLSFKETASLINAAHNFVQEVDEAVLKKFDALTFCLSAVQDALSSRNKGNGFAAKYYGLLPEQRRSFLRTWFQNNHGFGKLEDEVIDACLNISKPIRSKHSS